MPDQHFVNRRETEAQLMKPNELVSQALDPETTFTTQPANELLLAYADFLARDAARPSAVAHQAGDARGQIPPDPFAQGRTTDSATETDEASVLCFFDQLHPNQSLRLRRC
jgi:hypothetical protein